MLSHCAVKILHLIDDYMDQFFSRNTGPLSFCSIKASPGSQMYTRKFHQYLMCFSQPYKWSVSNCVYRLLQKFLINLIYLVSAFSLSTRKWNLKMQRYLLPKPERWFHTTHSHHVGKPNCSGSLWEIRSRISHTWKHSILTTIYTLSVISKKAKSSNTYNTIATR